MLFLFKNNNYSYVSGYNLNHCIVFLKLRHTYIYNYVRFDNLWVLDTGIRIEVKLYFLIFNFETLQFNWVLVNYYDGKG